MTGFKRSHVALHRGIISFNKFFNLRVRSVASFEQEFLLIFAVLQDDFLCNGFCFSESQELLQYDMFLLPGGNGPFVQDLATGVLQNKLPISPSQHLGHVKTKH